MTLPIDLSRHTVLVLGAGASQPYGFPLSADLKVILIAHLNSPEFRAILGRNGFDQALVDEFAEALSGTYHQTIDVFLEKKTRFRECGSWVIAHALLPYEMPATLFPEKNWYAHLYHTLKLEHIEELPDTRNIKIVSLNYDRSLEHFLTKNVRYNCPDDALSLAVTKLGLLEVIHAHGSLGCYPEVPYGSNNSDISILKSAAAGIRITSDRLGDSGDFRAAQAAIRDADNLIFIGFGFDQRTLGLLTAGMGSSQKRIVGTSHQLAQAKADWVSGFFKGGIELLGTGVTAEEAVKLLLPLEDNAEP